MPESDSPTEPSEPPVPTEPSEPTEKSEPKPELAELRLALVCYGGVSLAVYMHGVTKELHKLIVASRKFDSARQSGNRTNPFLVPATNTPAPKYDTEAVYFDVLADLEDRGHPLAVNIDIIGGTSAGGINGVVLAKAIAINAPQDALRELWINEGDLRKLLRAPAIAGLKVQAGLAVVWAAASAWRATSLLRSDVMSKNLLDALQKMDAGSPTVPGDEPTSLIPWGRRLQLFVTTTDQAGFEVVVPSGAGGLAQRDHSYAQVMEFRSGHTDDPRSVLPFDETATPLLAFAARATSAFPAAFQPVSLSRFLTEVRNAITVKDADFGKMFRFQGPQNTAVTRTDAPHRRWSRIAFWRRGHTEDEKGDENAESLYIDGGLLNNAPFDLVIDAISREEAHHEVIRRLVYIEPDPKKSLSEAVRSYSRGAGSFVDDLMGIKGPLTSHSFLKDLLRLRDMNARIDEIGDIATLQKGDIEAEIQKRVAIDAQRQVAELRSALGADKKLTIPETTTFLQQLLVLESAKGIADDFYAEAESTLKPTWKTYQRLKAVAIADRVATAIIRTEQLPPDSSEAAGIRSALSRHVRTLPAWKDGGAELADTFLKGTDTPYRERRFLFIIAGINELYAHGGPDRIDVDGLKAVVWQELSRTQRAPENVVDAIYDTDFVAALRAYLPGSVMPESLSGQITTFFENYSRALAEHLGDDNNLIWTTFASTVHTAMSEGTHIDGVPRPGRGWTDDDFRLLASRYLGFPKWDAILFPVMALSKIPQFSPIAVSQFSPLEATTLSKDVDGRPPLYGNALAHFRAFLAPGYRQSDYLYGRLDGADLIIRLLAETTGDAAVGARAMETMSAVYRSERGLTKIPSASSDWLRRCFGSADA